MKKQIIAILKKEKAELSTTRIQVLIEGNKNYYAVLKILEEMEKERTVERIVMGQMGKYTFWRLRK